MRIAPSVGTGILAPVVKHVNKKKRALQARPLPAAAARRDDSNLPPGQDTDHFRRINLRIFLAKQFESIISQNEWDEGISMLGDLQEMISHHPDLREHADALRGLVDGFLLMSRLLNEVNAL